MSEPPQRSGAPGAAADDGPPPTLEPAVIAKPQHHPYLPASSAYTPPASPQPSNRYANSAAPKGFGNPRSRRPADLQMDVMSAHSHGHPGRNPSPSSSPTLPPLPSPHFPPRPRAPSLLRHPTVPSPLNEGYSRAEQPTGSPTFAPMARQGSAPGSGPPSDARVFFNPLASNPVDHNGPSWSSLREELSGTIPQRVRGLTSASQQGFVPHPPLRTATSIQDYGLYRGMDRPNPSGAYRPNRGGANWSHNDHFPVRHFRPEESRASFRSAWTNASSSFVDASGTERSSMATGRSSISENRTSVYSVEHPGDRDLSGNAPQDTEIPSMEDDFISVEDVIDSYCYDDDDEEVSMLDTTEDVSQFESSFLDSEVPGLSQTHSQSDRGSTPLTPDRNTTNEYSQPLADRPVSYLGIEDDDCHRHDSHINSELSPSQRKAQSPHDTYLPPLQLSPVDLKYSPTVMSKTEEHSHTFPAQEQHPPAPRHQQRAFGDIFKDLQELPPLPKNKSRLSRQDWAHIRAYSRKHSKGSVHLHEQGNPTSPKSSVKRVAPAPQSPPIQESSPLPEVDKDEAYPRRASTSVFDRRSTLLQLSKVLSTTPPSSPPRSTKRGSDIERQPTGKRRSGQTAVNYIASPSRTGTQTTITVVERDRYGFKKITDKISAEQYDTWYKAYEPYVSRRRAKWVTLMEKNNLPTSDPVKFPGPCDKVKRYTRKGYPPEWRGAMWWFYSDGQKKLDQMPGVYASLVARVRQGELNRDDREAIEKDLDRTFPDNIHFRPDPTPGDLEGTPQEEPDIIKNLHEVLQCFALNNPSIGYCQSLNFIAGLLLLFMKQDVEKVFVLLTIITQYHLPGAHARSLANTEVNVLMMLIKDYLPKVWASINDTDLINNGLGSHVHPDSKFQRQPTVALSCTSWFMSLFVGVLPIEVVLRVWDAFLYEGPRALFRYALAIFKLGEPEIRKFHPGDGELFMTVQNLPRTCLDPNVLHDIAFVKKGFGSLSQAVIDQKRGFWERQQLARKESSKDGAARRRKDGDVLPEDEKVKTNGLRRKASRRFFRKDKA